MNKFALICEGFANGDACAIEGQLLKTFDPEHGGGTGYATFTHSPVEAKLFDSPSDALDFLNTVPACAPTRPDGLPNKPLWATNWSIAEVGEDQ